MSSDATRAGSASSTAGTNAAGRRAAALADRLEQGAQELAAFASALTDAQWSTRMPGDGRTMGVIVHHVASVYPVEIHLARALATGKPVEGVTVGDVHAMNAEHAKTFSAVTRPEALDLLRKNSLEASTAIRALSDEELDRAAPASLYGNAPVTCQFMLEDHAVRHSYDHLAKMRRSLQD